MTEATTITLESTPTIGRCACCKHWLKVADVNPWGQCRLAESYHGQPSHVQTLAVAGDTEPWHAWLDTHEDFGCTQYEPKK